MGSLLPNEQNVDALASLLTDAPNDLAVLDALPDAAVVADAGGAVRYLNLSAGRLLGVAPADAVGQPADAVLSLIDSDTRDPIAEPLAHLLSGPEVCPVGRYPLLVRREGAPIPVDYSIASARSARDACAGFVLLLRDASAVHARFARLVALARGDRQAPLMGRGEFVQHLLGAMDSMEAGERHALLVIGVEGLEKFHQPGVDPENEAAWREIATRIRARIRARDMLTYLGSGQFGVFLSRCSFSRTRSEALQGALANQPLDAADRHHTGSVGMGILSIGNGRHGAGAAMAAAATACRRALESRGTTFGIVETALD